MIAGPCAGCGSDHHADQCDSEGFCKTCRPSSNVVISSPKGLERFRLLQIKYAMKIEICTGMRHSRLGSVVAKVKKRYGYRGKPQAVYELFCKEHGL